MIVKRKLNTFVLTTTNFLKIKEVFVPKKLARKVFSDEENAHIRSFMRNKLNVKP